MLFITTPCSRPQNLEAISKTIPKECYWAVIHEKHIPMPKINNAHFIESPKNGFVGANGRNHFLDNHTFNDNDWIYCLDDDNIIHPDFYSTIKEYLDSDYSVIHWGQLTRYGLPRLKPVLELNRIDAASFMVKWKYNKNIRFNTELYNCDGMYAVDCGHQGPVLKIEKNLCYYNYLQRKNHTDIHGWFNYEKTFDFLVSKVPDGGIFVECGAWLGKSSAYLCDIAKDRISVFIVDTWLGSPDELDTSYKLAKSEDIYKLFLKNMETRSFHAIRQPSIEAVNTFEDGSCDVVFIDMDHSYEAVKQDIETWLPKVKIGGYIAGHDYTSDWQGVVKAVNEKFPQDKILKMDTCWIVQKENT